MHMSALSVLVARRVRMFRKLRDLSQEALAEQVGVSVETISNIERAQHPPTLVTLDRLLEALHVSVAEFFASSADVDDVP